MAIEIGSRDAVRGSVPFNDVAIILDPLDAVGVAKRPLLPGTVLVRDNGEELRIAQMVPPGHKFALIDIANDAPVRRYGQIIGFATADIKPGQHVHVQNMSIKEQGSLKVDYAIGTEYKAETFVPESERRTFMGFRRKDGRVGTRNYVAVLASVNCSSSATVRSGRLFPATRRAQGLPERRRRHRLPAQGRLRRAHRLARSPALPAHAGRDRPPPERRRLRHPQPRLRGQPADRHDRVDDR